MRRLTTFFFLATLFCCTFEKVHWNFGGQLALSDVLALCFIGCYLALTRPRVARTSAACSRSKSNSRSSNSRTSERISFTSRTTNP